MRLKFSVILLAALTWASQGALFAEDWSFHLQRRVAEADTGAVRVEQSTQAWKPSETAIIVCDMWDRHWCDDATARVAEMAPHMNRVLGKARERGALIVHAPSSTLDFYRDTPQRARARAAAYHKMAIGNTWQHLDPALEGALPIDDSDGGCVCDGPCENVNQSVWSRQIDSIHIDEADFISDDGQEVFNILKSEGRRNVILLGVHTNMCVLGRSFGIRAQVRNGMNVALMRDMTDSMYNPAMAPHVDHFRGTDLVVQHIERHWCATLTSTDITGEAPFVFQGDQRAHAVFLIQEHEYDSKRTLVAFAEEELARKRNWRITCLMGNGDDDLPGLAVLRDPEVDVMVISMRRQVLPQEQLDRIKAYVAAGRPVVGIRTASHAFSLREGELSRPGAQWPEFDQEVLGGNYTGHHGNSGPDDPRTVCWPVNGLAEVSGEEAPGEGTVQSLSWLYKVSPLRPGAEVLMMGKVEGRGAAEPVAWRYGGNVFYTSLGHPDDFEQPWFVELLVNGITGPEDQH